LIIKNNISYKFPILSDNYFTNVPLDAVDNSVQLYIEVGAMCEAHLKFVTFFRIMLCAFYEIDKLEFSEVIL